MNYCENDFYNNIFKNLFKNKQELGAMMIIKNCGIFLILIFFFNMRSITTLPSSNTVKTIPSQNLPAQELKDENSDPQKITSENLSLLGKLIIKIKSIREHKYNMDPMTELDTNRFDA